MQQGQHIWNERAVSFVMLFDINKQYLALLKQCLQFRVRNKDWITNIIQSHMQATIQWCIGLSMLITVSYIHFAFSRTHCRTAIAGQITNVYSLSYWV